MTVANGLTPGSVEVAGAANEGTARAATSVPAESCFDGEPESLLSPPPVEGPRAFNA